MPDYRAVIVCFVCVFVLELFAPASSLSLQISCDHTYVGSPGGESWIAKHKS